MIPIELDVRNLKVSFSTPQGNFSAVNGVSFQLHRGETLALVGESGCGKTVSALSILQLLPKLAVNNISGEIIYSGKNLLSLDTKQMRKIRGKEISMIFQDPSSSINPRRTIGEVLSEPFAIHGFKENVSESIIELLNQVGLSPNHANRYPHEMSGGQLQRVGIARAIALNPSLVVADEPVSALDVSVQAQVVNLMIDLKEKLRISYLFISHDMGVVKYFCDRVAVMYLGKIVEIASSEEIYKRPCHPYTEALLNAVPGLELGKTKQKLKVLGDTPDPSTLSHGCSFYSRCPIKEKQCKEMEPTLKEITSGHYVACFLK